VVLAMLDGHQALDTVGKRLEARGMVTRLQPGLTRAARNDDRLGPILEALLAAKLNQVCSAVALNAVAVEAIPTPGRQQDTTPIRLYGASEDAPKSPEAPPPAYGPSQEGRDDRTQVLRSLGVSGDGGRPLRLGLRDGHRRDRVETPRASAACLALGVDGVRGLVAESQASRRRTRGGCLEQGMG
jgi:hypothetical protein